MVPPPPEDLAAAVAGARWYHTLELPGGVVTPGEYDLRPVLARVPLPASLAGRRCLDVGTRDGFWAFAMEARGAAAVVGIDLRDHRRLDWPGARPPPLDPAAREDLARRDRTFAVAAAALGSRVERRERSVYELDLAVDGTFDFAVVGTLLHHLRDPVGALAGIRRVLRGPLLVNEVVSLSLGLVRRGPAAALMTTGEPFWWVPNPAALRRYVEAAGFRVVAAAPRPYLVPRGPGAPGQAAPLGGVRGRVQAAMLRRGAPHVWLLAEPA